MQLISYLKMTQNNNALKSTYIHVEETRREIKEIRDLNEMEYISTYRNRKPSVQIFIA